MHSPPSRSLFLLFLSLALPHIAMSVTDNVDMIRTLMFVTFLLVLKCKPAHTAPDDALRSTRKDAAACRGKLLTSACCLFVLQST